jgi:hypothetical protein
VIGLVFATFESVVIPLFSSPSWKQVQPVLPAAYEFLLAVVQTLGEAVSNQVFTIVGM